MRMWHSHDLKKSYDVVIIGAGVHGLAIAYYLGKRGITNVAVLDKGYLGGGASGRNTAIIRSNYRTPQGVAFYDESVKLYETLALELDYNVMFSQQGHLTVAHTERGVTTLRERAETNRSWPACTTPRAASSATTRWSGATPAAWTGKAWRSTPTPR